VTRLLFAIILVSQCLSAGVVSVDIAERSEAPHGYERIVGTAHFAVDPNDPANQHIHGLKAAPTNSDGLVEFSSDIHILRPRDPKDSNGAVLFEAVNRGGKGIFRMFNYAQDRDDAGDGFLMRHGYTVVWVGWQFDLIDSPDRMRFVSPNAVGVEGWVRSNFRTLTAAAEFSIAGAGHVPYAPIDTNDPSYRLIDRTYNDSEGTGIPRDRWRFSDSSSVTLDGGFTPGHSYEVIYRSKDPGLPGLGPTTVRDFVSYLRFDPEALDGSHHYDRAIAFGISQSGRFLRTYLYDGYNADEGGRKVFDGIWPHIAGAARGNFTNLFAQPTRTDPFYEIDVFPFRDRTDRDPVTGAEDGILRRATAANVVPKIFYTNTSNEYWGRSASLLHTTLDGKKDITPLDTTRIYHFTGTQHGAGTTPPPVRPAFRYPLNSNDYKPFMRALLLRFDAWVKEGTEPPASQYPSVQQLATLEALDFPKFEGSLKPGRLRHAMRLDYGLEYRAKGLAIEPPKVVGDNYPVMIPQLDVNGNEIGGLKLPSVTVPLATYAGWNLTNPSVLDSPEITGNTGSTMPFSSTRALGAANNDARPSVEELYESREQYLELISSEIAPLEEDGYLLDEDRERILGQAGRMWDSVTKQ
jgi:hypothetical protein